ncbi:MULTISPECIES: helix-turn-helix domain-containing protein [Microcella]|uniref:helix-turn-helix domain-containing protein n=1 Tax=Microcella TaxID=337004 RepID=UPI0015CF3D94|nr:MULTISPECIES: helix-turn-helix domain-containing protein [Microcella]QOD93782.1 helix-turn-helix domain-containing protein [Chryseoglobus sp. 28M-23]
MTTLTLSNDSIIVDDQLRDEAIELVETAEDDRLGHLEVVINGTNYEVPESLSRLLVHVIERAARGGTMHIRSMPEELTTTVAAELLGVSRPTFMKLIKAGDIRSRIVGTHHRVLAQDVVALRDRRNDARVDAIRALREVLPD